MRKEKLSRICGWISAVLAALFAAQLIRDRIVYNTTLNSAPFYIWVLVDAVMLLLPALLFFAAHLYFKKKPDLTRNRRISRMI